MAINWQDEFSKAAVNWQQDEFEQLEQAYRLAVSQAAQPLSMEAYYNQAYAGLADSYDQALGYYGQARQAQLEALAAQRDAGLAQYGQQLDAAQGQNYIGRMMTERANPQMMASMGLTGGAVEKLRARQAAEYAGSRAQAQAAYNGSVAGLAGAQAQQQAQIEAQYAQQQQQLAARRQDAAREESRYLWGQDEDARRYAIDTAFRDYETAVGNTRWLAGYDLDVARYQTGVDQWNQEFAEDGRQHDLTLGQNQNQFDQKLQLDKEKLDWQKTK